MNAQPAETIPAPLWLFQTAVEPGWIDYNGHLTDGYYAVVFGWATDALLDYLDLDAAYRAASGCTVYTLEMHINYLREVKGLAALTVASLLLGADARRLQFFHSLHADEAGFLAATAEVMLLHVDAEPKAAPFPPERTAWINQVAAAHASYPRPARAGRGILQLGQPPVL